MIEARERLRQAGWLARPETQQLLALLDGEQRRTRVVGGAVRDTLLGLDQELADLDFATELMPGDVTARAERAGVSVYPTGLAHGTVTLKAGTLVAEVTTLREDVETDGRHAVVRFGQDWREDAARRDFTLNALYAEMDGTLFDPLGGLADCLERRVRFIGDASRRIAEDRLRVYRFFRFTASHGEGRLDSEGLAACAAAAGELGQLAAERVGAEMRRMLALPRVARTFKAMVEIGLPFPAEALELLQVYERRARRADYGSRLALVFSAVDREALRLRWRLSNDDMQLAEDILVAGRLIGAFRINEAAYRYPAVLAGAVEVAAVLSGWSEAGREAVLEQLSAVSVPRFPLSGSDLIAAGQKPGPELGERLRRLEAAWIDSGFTLDRAALLARIDP
jgi:poly(A) polymerase